MPTLRSNTTMTSDVAAPGDVSPEQLLNRYAESVLSLRAAMNDENYDDAARIYRESRDSILFLIRAATPTSDAGEAVTIRLPDAKVLREICRRTRNKGDQLAAAYYVKWFDQAIAASGGRHDGE